MNGLKNIFETEIKTETGKYNPGYKQPKQRPLTDLPFILQQYLRYCGYNGDEQFKYCSLKINNAFIKLDPGKSWMPISCKQVNFLPEPARIVLMEAKVLGLFGFGARDKFQNGLGNMLIKLLDFFVIADAKGKEMNEAALVTILAETALLPTYALQPYIEWTEINLFTVTATIRYKEIEVSGIFYFNDLGLIDRFETNCRYFTEKDGNYTNIKWTAKVSNYIENNGLKFPSVFTAIWNKPDGDFEYFKATIESLSYNAVEF